MFSSPLLPEKLLKLAHMRVSPKRPYNAAMTSAFCATQKSTLTVAWRFAS